MNVHAEIRGKGKMVETSYLPKIQIKRRREEAFNSLELCVDDFYLSALYDEDEIIPVKDEKYAEELQLQEALVSSAISSNKKRTRSPVIENPPTPKKICKSGESSRCFCAICMDGKPPANMFRNNNCPHSFCTECVSKYIAVKVKENIAMVKCPDFSCQGTLEPGLCCSILPRDVFERWEEALCESLVLGAQKFYCPYKDCSALLVDDGGVAVTSSECPSCRRLFCAQCKVPWHGDLECKEFRQFNRDGVDREDMLMTKLARDKKWRRCPKCKFYVEKADGCLHISCRCGFEFCYGCGLHWNQTHECPPRPRC